MTRRQFSHSKAVRERVNLQIGLAGPAGAGKTMNALNIAQGLEEKRKGKVFLVDTQGGRALHYAQEYDFQHVDMREPFSPQDYRSAIEYCVHEGAGTIIIDSMSHEHTGKGGVLDIHDRSNKRGMDAWADAKAGRKALIQAMRYYGCHMILCFEATDKMVEVFNEKKGKNEQVKGGWYPTGGTEYAYEMTAFGVLEAGAKGATNWESRKIGSGLVTKRPEYLKGILKSGQKGTVEMGRALAVWAKGDPTVSTLDNPDKVNGLLAKFQAAKSTGELNEVAKGIDKSISASDRAVLVGAYTAASQALS